MCGKGRKWPLQSLGRSVILLTGISFLFLFFGNIFLGNIFGGNIFWGAIYWWRGLLLFFFVDGFCIVVDICVMKNRHYKIVFIISLSPPPSNFAAHAEASGWAKCERRFQEEHRFQNTQETVEELVETKEEFIDL